jgi:hypothetical protein
MALAVLIPYAVVHPFNHSPVDGPTEATMGSIQPPPPLPVLVFSTSFAAVVQAYTI